MVHLLSLDFYFDYGVNVLTVSMPKQALGLVSQGIFVQIDPDVSWTADILLPSCVDLSVKLRNTLLHALLSKNMRLKKGHERGQGQALRGQEA